MLSYTECPTIRTDMIILELLWLQHLPLELVHPIKRCR
jgi:hypothetical protein